MTKTISSAEVRKHWGEIAARVTYSGDEYHVLKYGKPSVVIAPSNVVLPNRQFKRRLKRFMDRYDADLKKLAKR